MSCTNCFNGCEIVSDRCVKYTGIDIPELGIQTGDSLSHVEQSITTYLVSVLNGSGVKIDLTGINVCNTVQKYLPVCSNCTDVSIVDISKALIKAACDIQVQIDALGVSITNIEAPYTTECLTVGSGPSLTHQVLQAVITKLCTLKSDFNELVIITLPTEYVLIDDLYDLIQGYLDSNGGANVIANRMVPYSVVPYFGPLTFFDSAGEGIDFTGSGGQDWRNIYLCNGNKAPDLRGFGLVGAINGVPGGALNSRVDPAIPGANNPNYSLYSIDGLNQVTLSSAQIPPLAHTHGNTAVSTISPNPHTHAITPTATQTGQEVGSAGSDAFATSEQNNTLLAAETSLTVATTVNIASTTLGEGLPHTNIQPVVACYYIQYRP